MIIAEQRAVIAKLRTVIAEMQRRIGSLEARLNRHGSAGMPGNKPLSGRQSPEKKELRKPRRHGFARKRMTPTRRVEHAVEVCPDCGTHLAGGWIQRTREVIELPVVPVEVTEHVFIARVCPVCEQRRLPQQALQRVVLGQQRLGGQSGEPNGDPAGRGTATYTDHPMVPRNRPSVAPERGSHRPDYQWSGSSGPVGGPRGAGASPGQSGGAGRRNRLAPGGGSTAMFGSSAPPPNDTSWVGVGVRGWWMRC